ncbi:MAG: DUF805 domain-containing protein [Crocinitomicaceae bacterium]
MQWYLKVLKQYADFNGRARRQEYWMFFLMNLIFSLILGVVDGIIGTYDETTGWGLLGGLYSLFILVPSLAVGVRRLHDTNKSGWMLLVALIPLVGGIWLLVLFVTDGDKGPNQYGPDPKNPAAVFAENDELLDV